MQLDWLDPHDLKNDFCKKTLTVLKMTDSLMVIGGLPVALVTTVHILGYVIHKVCEALAWVFFFFLQSSVLGDKELWTFSL